MKTGKNRKAITAGILAAAALLVLLYICIGTDLIGRNKTGENVTLTLNELSEYTVVYPEQDDNAKLLAHWLANKISEELGVTLTVTNDAEEAGGREMLVGTTDRTDCTCTTQALEQGRYLIGADEAYICARGADAVGDYYAVHDLMAALLEQGKEEYQAAIVSEVKEVPVSDTLKAMSFNILYKIESEERCMSVLQTILKCLPDTVGFQEATPEWMAILEENLGGIYDHVGVGRDDGENKGEHAAIFYRKDRFELVETGTMWLSDTPDVVSKYEGGYHYRIFTYAILKEKQSEKEMMVINTHLEDSSGKARRKQVAVLMDFIGEHPDYPTVLTGDFNSKRSSAEHRAVTEILADSFEIAQTKEDEHTLLTNGTVVDYAFVSPQSIEVLDYRVVLEKENGMLPSDHAPVLIQYSIKN